MALIPRLIGYIKEIKSIDDGYYKTEIILTRVKEIGSKDESKEDYTLKSTLDIQCYFNFKRDDQVEAYAFSIGINYTFECETLNRIYD